MTLPEAVVQRCFVRKVFLEIPQNSQKTTVPESKVVGLKPANLFKKRLWHRCFAENFVKFLRTPFFIELWWLLPLFIKNKIFQHQYQREVKVFSLFFHFCYFMIGFLWSLYLYKVFLWCGERLNTRANQKKIKSSRKEYAMWTCFKFWPMKNIFRKIQANRSLAMAWEIYRELLPLATYLRVHSNSKEVSYLSWQNKYSNLKATCHTKLKFFLWTKLLENLLIAKYLISVAATLNNKWKKLCCYTISKNL